MGVARGDAEGPCFADVQKKDIEVLMLSDHLDEPCIQKLADYEGKKFVSIQKADVKLDETEDEKKRFTKLKDMYKPLTDWWKEKLTDLTEKGAMKDAGVKIEKVELSKRLTESPVVVVTSQFGYSAQQEKVMKAQAFQNKEQLGMMSGRKTLEINPNHPVVIDLLSKVKADKDDKPALDTASVVPDCFVGVRLRDRRPVCPREPRVPAHVEGAWCGPRCTHQGGGSARRRGGSRR